METIHYTSDISIKEEMTEEADTPTNKKLGILIKQEVIIEDFIGQEDGIVDNISHEIINNSIVKIEDELIIDNSSIDNDANTDLAQISLLPAANTAQTGVEYIEDDANTDLAQISLLPAANTAQTGVEYIEDGPRKIRKTHKCPQCNYRTVRVDHITRHVNTVHLKHKPHKCSQCKFQAANEASLKKHKMLKHPLSKPYQCPDCDHTTIRKYNMIKHRLSLHSVVHPLPVHRCKHCGFKSDSFVTLGRHLASNHKNNKRDKTVQAKEKIHLCSKCEYKTVQLSKLKRHVLAKHRSEKWRPYHCPNCNYKTAYKRDMKRHAEINHQEKRMQNTLVLEKDPDHLKDDILQCTFCDFTTVYRHSMNRHVKSVHGKEKPFQCPLCAFIGKDSCFLKQHMMIEHPEKKVIGNEVDSDDKTPRPVVVLKPLPMLAEHHVNAISSNQRHSIINQTEFINYECSHCDFKTTTPLHLNRHVKAIHTKDKPYQCSQCGFRTAEVSLLEKHVMTTHLKEDHYQCPDCSYKTIDINEMNKHTTIIHPTDNLHECQHCSYSSENKEDFEKHTFSYHTNMKNHNVSKTMVSKLTKTMDEQIPLKNLNQPNNANALETENHIMTLHQVDELSVIGNTIIINSRGKDSDNCINQEIMIYQCSQCKYKTKNPHNLTRHATVHHANVVEIKDHIKYLYQDSKHSIIGYITILKAPPKFIIHLCSQCEFQTKYSLSLTRHAARNHGDAVNTENHIKDQKEKVSAIKRANVLKCHKKTKEQYSKGMIQQCLKCEYKTKYAHHMTRHVKAIHAKQKMFECSQCSFKTVESSSLKRHNMLKHPLEKICDFPNCNYKTVSERDMKKHLENHKLKNLLHQCSHCNYETALYVDLKEHMSNLHEEENSDRCQDGVIKSDSLTDLERPVTANHTNNKIQGCPFCEFTSAYIHSVRRHIRRLHPEKKPYKCLLCKYKSSDISLLNQHVMMKHQQECPNCNYRTANKCEMKKHIETHHQGANISKVSAPSQSKNSPISINDVTKRISTAHTTYESPILKNSTCEEKRGLNNHDATSSENKHHFTCEFKTASPDSLNKHTRNRNRSSLQCSYCQFKGPNFKLLKQHVRKTHHKNSLSKVTISYDEMERDKSKIKDMVIKNINKRYHCNQCKYNTACISNLEKHENGFHKSDMLFNCPMCNYKTTQLKYLQEHVGTKHV